MINLHLKDGILYKFNNLCVHEGERIQLIKEEYTSHIASNFFIGKTLTNLQRYVYWPKMQEQVESTLEVV